MVASITRDWVNTVRLWTLPACCSTQSTPASLPDSRMRKAAGVQPPDGTGFFSVAMSAGLWAEPYALQIRHTIKVTSDENLLISFVLRSFLLPETSCLVCSRDADDPTGL